VGRSNELRELAVLAARVICIGAEMMRGEQQRGRDGRSKGRLWPSVSSPFERSEEDRTANRWRPEKDYEQLKKQIRSGEVPSHPH